MDKNNLQFIKNDISNQNSVENSSQQKKASFSLLSGKRIVSIMENRTREIGISTLSADFAELTILEFSDTQTYSFVY
jgi:hypothetical protein